MIRPSDSLAANDSAANASATPAMIAPRVVAPVRVRAPLTLRISHLALRWMLVAGLIRLGAMLLLHFYSVERGFKGLVPFASGGDDGGYLDYASALYYGQQADFVASFYPVVLSWYFHLIGGPDLLLGKMLNVVAGTLTVGIGVLTVEELTRGRASKRVRRRAANWSGLLLTFYIPAIWCSSLLFKDSLLVLFGITALYCQVCFLKKPRAWSMGGWVAASLALFLFRPYAAVAIGVGLMIFVVRFNRKWLAPSLALVTVAPYFLGLGWFGWRYIEPWLNAERVSNLRESAYATGAGSVGITIDYSNPITFLASYSYSFATAMFGPFPWQLTGVSQAIALPEAFVMWALFPLWWRSVRGLTRRKSRDTDATRDATLLIFCLVLVSAIAFFSDNIGANTRLRMLPWSAFFLFASIPLARKRVRL